MKLRLNRYIVCQQETGESSTYPLLSPGSILHIIFGALAEHESLLLESMCERVNWWACLVRVRCTSFRYESAVPEDVISACVRSHCQV